ncbi:ComM-related protein [Desulfocucumis palustris]|uniref:ComM-related protein n=1 Tax=Desulfocucumis palustris TaxID=1898651 RepID=A0A2L2X768_9FIRM|nr:YifB family Mg chelatase-like AAA ATPase [Desulfocucumis palustris]GBF32027.1 ComM-related protein [Desulfocucumis palustris]
MLSIINSTALHGLAGHIVKVEVDVSNGLPCFDLVGLPDVAVRESRDRVRAAIKNSGFEFPVKRITVNLAPADIKKEGPMYDLAIAVGVLAATGQIDPEKCGPLVFIGELSLKGDVRGVAGVLPNVLAAVENGFTSVVVPRENAGEAALVRSAGIYPVSSLNQLSYFLTGEEEIFPYTPDENEHRPGRDNRYPDFSEVKGQYAARRALEVAAAGGHNVLMTGSPGSGKTMLARCLPGIMPDLSFEEALETTKIYSLAGLLKPGQAMITERPYRAPHHSASSIALVGGGKYPRPGEISLAHNGILFLDEMPEFHKDALEALRQPLEDGTVTISRINASLSYPARLMLIGSCNPCPCGYHGDTLKDCNCTPLQVQRYMGRISGPLLDRIDIIIDVPRVTFDELADSQPGETSEAIKKRVEAARAIQRERFKNSGTGCNANMTGSVVRKNCLLSREASSLLKSAFKQLKLSARSHDRVLKVARTVADLAGSERIQAEHLAEAVQYRREMQGG